MCARKQPLPSGRCRRRSCPGPAPGGIRARTRVGASGPVTVLRAGGRGRAGAAAATRAAMRVANFEVLRSSRGTSPLAPGMLSASRGKRQVTLLLAVLTSPHQLGSCFRAVLARLHETTTARIYAWLPRHDDACYDCVPRSNPDVLFRRAVGWCDKVRPVVLRQLRRRVSGA